MIKWKITDFINILGSHFNNDIEMTNGYNIIQCIQKMETNVKLQNQRHLSLKGKTITINININECLANINESLI